VSIVGASFMDECLLSLEQQAKDYGSEVIVVGGGAVGRR